MKSNASSMTAAAILALYSSAAAAENIMTCFASVALGRNQQLDARTVLTGRTVKVWAITQEGVNTSNSWLFEKEPIVRSFTADSLTESQGGEKATDAITYEGKGWCRKDAFESRKKCYGVIAMRVGPGKFEYREVELRDDGGFCDGYITAKLEGLAAAEPVSEASDARGRTRAPGEARQAPR